MSEQDRNSSRGPLPEGVPEPPDPGRVEDLRERMAEDQSERTGRPRIDLGGRRGKQARDIGTYTVIPMMMIAGPLVGYLMGKGWENLFGGEPWPGVVGLLVGMVAAFRQVFLLLARRPKRGPRK